MLAEAALAASCRGFCFLRVRWRTASVALVTPFLACRRKGDTKLPLPLPLPWNWGSSGSSSELLSPAMRYGLWPVLSGSCSHDSCEVCEPSCCTKAAHTARPASPRARCQSLCCTCTHNEPLPFSSLQPSKRERERYWTAAPHLLSFRED